MRPADHDRLAQEHRRGRFWRFICFVFGYLLAKASQKIWNIIWNQDNQEHQE